MSIIGSNILAGAAGSGVSAYEIEQSLRFNSGDTHYLNRTPGSAGNRQVFTISFWIKRSALGGKDICTGDDQNGFLINFQTGDALYLYDPNAASGGFQIWSARVFRDTSAWYHIVVAVDSTQATDSNRVKVYINGEQENLATWNVGAGASRYPTQNANLDWNNTNSHEIGTSNNYGYLDGYLSEFYNIDGSALDADNFGEFDDSGVWRPIQTSGLTYGTNGFYLKFDETASNGIGHDHSGNGNNFTANNFTTSGTGTDVMSDTPTKNYATLNPLWARNTYGLSTLSNGNLEFSASGLTTSWGGRGSTFEITSGKWYCEWAVGGASPTSAIIAVMNTGYYGLEHFMVQNPQTKTGFWGPQQSDPSRDLRINGSLVTTSSPYFDSLNGAITGVAIDADAGTATWYRNGTAISGLTDIDITAGDGDAWVVMGLTSNSAATTFIANFGQRAFEQTPPTGYSPWNTANLPAPDIKDGSDYFQTITYSGTSAARSLTVADNSGNGWQPDLVWIKSRNDTYYHRTIDAVRGATKELYPNDVDTEATVSTSLTSFNSNGFSLGSSGAVNETGKTFVAWNWKTGATPGFDIVTHTNTNDSTVINHSLGVAPEFIISKARNSSATQWRAHHVSGGVSQTLILSTDQGFVASGERVTAVSSSTFTYDATVTPNGTNFIHYLWSGVEGYSKFGSYVGNGNADGPFIYTGFRPAFLIYKNTVTGYWNIRDSARNPFNPNNNELYPNVPDNENTHSSTRYIDFLSNGFKIRSDSGPVNGSGNTIIYMVFAENPLGGDGVSPATAR